MSCDVDSKIYALFKRHSSLTLYGLVMDKKDTRWNQKLLRKKRYPSPPLNSVDVTSTLVFNTVFDSLMDVKNFLKILNFFKQILFKTGFHL